MVAADEAVTTTDGTGLVHSAGAFGEIDKEVTDREGIEPVMPVGKDGKFTAPVDDYAGLLVFDANLPIIDDLKGPQGGAVTEGTVLLRRETYDHSYPHCWRCREPLIYKGVSSWFVEVTAIKERMLELNKQIRWVPEHIKDGPVRQVAGERPRLVDHPQPVLGIAGAGVAAATTRRTPGSTSTAASRSSSATSATCRATRTATPTCTARTSTSWSAPTPTTRPGSR